MNRCLRIVLADCRGSQAWRTIICIAFKEMSLKFNVQGLCQICVILLSPIINNMENITMLQYFHCIKFPLLSL